MPKANALQRRGSFTYDLIKKHDLLRSIVKESSTLHFGEDFGKIVSSSLDAKRLHFPILPIGSPIIQPLVEYDLFKLASIFQHKFH